jgi:hypothetical protein
LPDALLLAVASRETGCRDVVGDGGHGRGVFQIDDRFHHEWLAAHGAGETGKTPPVADAAEYAASMLAGSLAVARKHALTGEPMVKFSASAYNAGLGGALEGLRRGDSDLETTGRDYGRDVVARMRAFRALEVAQRAKEQGAGKGARAGGEERQTP